MIVVDDSFFLIPFFVIVIGIILIAISVRYEHESLGLVFFSLGLLCFVCWIFIFPFLVHVDCVCPVCNNDTKGYQFCPQCGLEVVQHCDCGRKKSDEFAFCPDCGLSW